jgi:hypothetical protein
MWTDAHPIAAAPAARAASPWRPARLALVLLTAAALLGTAAVAVRAPAVPVEPDLARVIRFMAAIKGAFALAALAGCVWRLARPAVPWRTAIYVAGPPAMAAGALALGTLHSPGLAAAALHLGLFGVLAAALTDSEFLPDRPRLRRR